MLTGIPTAEVPTHDIKHRAAAAGGDDIVPSLLS